MRSSARTIGSMTGAMTVERPMTPDARRDPGPVEVMLHLIAHELGLLGDLGPERALVLARLVGDHRQRRLERVREIADLRAGAVDDVLVGEDERVELDLKRLDLGRRLAFELGRLARAYLRQALLDAAQRQEPEPHLKQRDGNEPEAGERQRDGEPRQEVGDPALVPVDRSRDDDRIARLSRLVILRVDHLDHADRLADRPLGIHPPRAVDVGPRLLLERRIECRRCQRGGDEPRARRIVERLDLPVPARVRLLEQRLEAVLRRVGERAGAAHAVDGDGVDELFETVVEIRPARRRDRGDR